MKALLENLFGLFCFAFILGLFFGLPLLAIYALYHFIAKFW